MTLPHQARFLRRHRGENADLRILAKYIPTLASIVNATDMIIRLFDLKRASMIVAPRPLLLNVLKDKSDHVLQVRRVAYLGKYQVLPLPLDLC